MFKHMCNNLKIYVNLVNNLFYINDDDAINCTMQILSTYKKFVFMEFNKKCYNSNLHIQSNFVILMFIFIFLLILCSKFKHMCKKLKIYVNHK